MRSRASCVILEEAASTLCAACRGLGKVHEPFAAAVAARNLLPDRSAAHNAAARPEWSGSRGFRRNLSRELLPVSRGRVDPAEEEAGAGMEDRIEKEFQFKTLMQ